MGDSPVQRVVGDCLPTGLDGREVRARRVLLVLDDRIRIRLPVLGHVQAVQDCRHDVVVALRDEEERRTVGLRVVDLERRTAAEVRERALEDTRPTPGTA
jgi:hypothetical protein